MELVLGSAQFGNNYGLVNRKKIKVSDIKKIENLVIKYKINFIDTSHNYENSEKIIGSSRLNKLNIITKFKLPNKKIDINNWVDRNIVLSLKRLKVNKIYGLLVHDVNDVVKKNGKSYLNCLLNLKKIGIVKKIGVSVYSPQDLNLVWKFWKPDIVQMPFNVLDNRFLVSNWFKKLKKNKIKIFVRSCFLQGLLINDYASIKKFKKYKKILDKFSNWCLDNKFTQIKASLHFIKKFKMVDYLVVGFNSCDQLKEIVKNFNEPLAKIPSLFECNKLSLIDPRRWKY
jgi:aryl-alcohol dehydrogenase-like predicted oxidoreductase